MNGCSVSRRFSLLRIFAALLLASCGSEPEPLRLYSPDPAGLLLVDLAASPEGREPGLPRIIPEFSESSADLVLDNFLPDAEDPEAWRALSTSGEALRPGAALLGRIGGDQRAIPYRMDFNLIVFRRDSEALLPPGMLLGVDELREASNDFTGGPGYSPRWQPQFVYHAAVLAGAGFRADPETYAAWNREELEETVMELRDWVATEPEAAIAAEGRVFTSDPVSLLVSGRIGFWFLSASDFLRLPVSLQSQLGFRLLSAGGRVAVREDVLSLGVRTGRPRAREAEETIALLLEPEVQRAVMERSFVTQSGEPGFLGALPTSVAGLADLTSDYAPRLAPSIPPDQLLLYPRQLPRDWDRARATVIEPWLASAVLAEPTEPLDAAIGRYARQRGDVPR